MAITGRPKVKNPRTEIVSIRLTPAEKAMLEVAYGSAGKAARMAVDRILRGEHLDEAVRIEPTASAVVGEPTVTRGGVKYPKSKMDRDIAATIDEVTSIPVEALDAVAVNVPAQNIVIADQLDSPARDVRVTSPRQSGKTKLVDDVVAATPGAVKVERHVHRPTTKVGVEFYRDGVRMQEWACACGERLDRKVAK